jgi:hypothetical protein
MQPYNKKDSLFSLSKNDEQKDRINRGGAYTHEVRNTFIVVILIHFCLLILKKLYRKTI